ncbi:MAG TPA: hypothetical protein P5173_00880 [Bacilli bacterium]|nr:hypothetical protein [Bacilli bacterium]
MINLIKCHYSYLVSKTTVLMISIVLIIHLFSCFLIGYDCIDFSWQSQANQYYLESNLFFIKTTGIFIVVFLFSYSFITKQDNYCTLIITSNISRSKYFITKILTISLFLLGFLWIEVFIFIAIGGLYYPHVILEPDFLFLFIQLYLLMIYYGLFALVLIQCFDNIYMSIIPFAFYTIASIFQDEKDNFFIFKIILPTISTTESRGNYYQILFLMIILFFINGIIYQKRDF